METSKAYFEDTLRRFDTERRGRTLFQFCRDEGVDYKSLMAYKRSADPKGKGRKKSAASCTDTDPRLNALPAEGKAEYLRWSETFHRLTSSHLANVERLKEIRRLDPGHAAVYDWKIDSLLKEAAEVMEQWHGHRRRILEKYRLHSLPLRELRHE